MIARLRADGTLAPRKKTEMATKKIVEAYNDGMTDIGELCEVFGYSKNTIQIYLLNGGVKRGKPSHYKTHTPPNAKAQLITYEIAKGEKSLSEIAKQFSVSRQYVHQLKNRMERLKDV